MKRLLTLAAAVTLAWSCSPKAENPYEYRAPEFKKTYKVDIVPLNSYIITP